MTDVETAVLQRYSLSVWNKSSHTSRHYFFLIFRNKLACSKCRKVTKPNFWKKSQFFYKQFYTKKKRFLEIFSKTQVFSKCFQVRGFKLYRNVYWTIIYNFCIYSMPISWFDCRQYAKNWFLIKKYFCLFLKKLNLHTYRPTHSPTHLPTYSLLSNSLTLQLSNLLLSTHVLTNSPNYRRVHF